jgi:hypothetical protein
MILIALTAALLFAAPQQSAPQQSESPQSGTVKLQPYKLTPEQMEQARQKYEPTRQAVVHLNELAGSIHSEDDARAFIDAVAERYTGKRPSWITRGMRHRVAHAEYEAVSDPSRLIPEERIVNIWNEYVRELDAPEETLVTVAEVHNLRDAMYTSSQIMWKRSGFTQEFWTMPNIYATNADGKVASGCRALEALKILHDMFNSFQNVRLARERVQKGVLISDSVKQNEGDGTPRPQLARAQLMAVRSTNPLPSAESRYVQAHGERDYQHLLERGFAELFPKD